MIDKYQLRRGLDRVFRGRLLKFFKVIKKYKIDCIYGRKIIYNPYTDIGGILFFKGQFEENELSICKQYIAQDSIVLDIGANIGLHSVYFSNLASNGLVLAFEPAPQTFALLLKNIGTSRIIPVNIGLSDITGIVDFYEASDDAYSGLKDTKRKPIKNVRKILVFELDKLFEHQPIRRIDFVKIDVEGYEHNVLLGMQKIIDIYRPVIFCEIYQGTNSNSHPDKTVSLLTSKGYSAFVMVSTRLVPYEKHTDTLYNYLFVPRFS